jgi:NAD(P)-dependent dehydrogenase (short-subunit alcohol dehydrogenase family)
MVAAADVCNIDEMRAAVAAATERFGAIHGVIHAAGVVDDAPLLGKSPSAVEEVFAPKLHGTQVLDALFPDGSLQVLVLFSSTSTVTAPAGQIDYVAANEYLNAYAKSRAGGRTRVVAIDWGIWNEVGMAADALAERLGHRPPTPPVPAGVPLLDEAGFDAAGNRLFTARYDAVRAGCWTSTARRPAPPWCPAPAISSWPPRRCARRARPGRSRSATSISSGRSRSMMAPRATSACALPAAPRATISSCAAIASWTGGAASS